MGKLRLTFLISILLMLDLSYGEKIIQPYGLIPKVSYAAKHPNKNNHVKARALEQEKTADKNIQQSTEEQPEGGDEDQSKEEMIVSPEFIGAISHNHGESQEGFMQNQGFDKLITQTYNELDGYQVHSDVDGLKTQKREASKELEKLINLVLPKPDNQRIPDITQLRNISIDQLPIALP